jgi:hypothetical protein
MATITIRPLLAIPNPFPPHALSGVGKARYHAPQNCSCPTAGSRYRQVIAKSQVMSNVLLLMLGYPNDQEVTHAKFQNGQLQKTSHSQINAHLVSHLSLVILGP